MSAANYGPALIEVLAGGGAVAPELRVATPAKVELATSVDMPRLSYFEGPISNVWPLPSSIRLVGVWHLIRGKGPMGSNSYPQLRSQIEALRAAPKREQDRLKRALDYVTPAGTFAPTRSNRHLQTSSGLLVLDFDDLPDVAAARELLLADTVLGPDTALLFTSPSGTGLKVLLRLDPVHTYAQNFEAVAAYLTHHYPDLQVSLDAKCRDVSRACFLSFDPDAYLHPDYQVD